MRIIRSRDSDRGALPVSLTHLVLDVPSRTRAVFAHSAARSRTYWGVVLVAYVFFSQIIFSYDPLH